MPQKYSPTGEYSISGLLTGLIICSIAGTAIGGIAHLIGRFFYLIILFPFLMGIAGAMSLGIGIKKGKCRNVTVAILMGVVCASFLYGSMHFFDYLNFKSEFNKALKEQIVQENSTAAEQLSNTTESNSVESENETNAEKSEALNTPIENRENSEKIEDVTKAETKEEKIKEPQFNSYIDYFLYEEVQATGFIGYIKYSAKLGVSIGDIGREGSNIGEIGTYIYWVIEFGIILFFILSAASGAKDPFCSHCNEWHEELEFRNIHMVSAENMQSAMDSGNYNAAIKDLQYDVETPFATMSTFTCSSCENGEGVVKMKEITLNAKKKEVDKDIYENVIPHNALKGIIDGMLELQQKEIDKEVKDEVAS